MATPTDDNRDLLTVIARMRAKPGKEGELRRELEALIEPTRAEEGCVNYDLNQGTDDDAVFFFYENWVSEAALDEHLQTPPLQRFVGLVPELIDGELEIQKLRRVA